MKITLILIFILFSFKSDLIFSQNKQQISGTFYSGGFIPVGEFVHKAKPGINFGLDLEGSNSNFGITSNFTVNVAKENNQSLNLNRNMTIIEITVGPRWYFGNLKKIHWFISPSLGYYRINYDTYGDGNFGFNLCSGINYPVNNSAQITLLENITYFQKAFFKQHIPEFTPVSNIFLQNNLFVCIL